MRILKLKISALLTITLLFILSLVAIFIFVIASALNHSANHTQGNVTDPYSHIFLVNNLIKEADNMFSEMRELAYATHDIFPANNVQKEKAIQEIIESNKKTDALIEALNQRKYSENENDIVNNIKDFRIKYDIVAHDFLQQLKMGDIPDTQSPPSFPKRSFRPPKSQQRTVKPYYFP